MSSNYGTFLYRFGVNVAAGAVVAVLSLAVSRFGLCRSPAFVAQALLLLAASTMASRVALGAADLYVMTSPYLSGTRRYRVGGRLAAYALLSALVVLSLALPQFSEPRDQGCLPLLVVAACLEAACFLESVELQVSDQAAVSALAQLGGGVLLWGALSLSTPSESTPYTWASLPILGGSSLRLGILKALRRKEPASAFPEDPIPLVPQLVALQSLNALLWRGDAVFWGRFGALSPRGVSEQAVTDYLSVVRLRDFVGSLSGGATYLTKRLNLPGRRWVVSLGGGSVALVAAAVALAVNHSPSAIAAALSLVLAAVLAPSVNEQFYSPAGRHGSTLAIWSIGVAVGGALCMAGLWGHPLLVSLATPAALGSVLLASVGLRKLGGVEGRSVVLGAPTGGELK